MNQILLPSLSSVSKPLSATIRHTLAAYHVAALVLLVALGSATTGHAQAGEWAWMGGSSVLTANDNGEKGQPGVYGTKGKPALTNIPGGRLGAVSWTDQNGNFWLFGGAGLDGAETFGFLNDMWTFNPSTREWTWVTGSSTIPSFNGGQPGVYGVRGTAAAANTPGSRSGGLSWTDRSGNLWLFGGGGFDAVGANGNLNDLWEFNPSTREWMWVGGSSSLGSRGSVSGVYGPLGSLTSGSFPGSRNNGATWTDKNGNLWLMGGYGEDSAGQFGQLNDLWEYVPSTEQWAWMGGSKIGEQPGIYGSLGTPAAANMPGARDTGVTWVDDNGNFWLFGGYGFVLVGSNDIGGSLNDLWEFDPSTREWRWMGGSNTFRPECLNSGTGCGSPGVYGTLGTAAAGNIPGSRQSPIGWTDRDGAFWLFGGIGLDATGSAGMLDDLWKFNPLTDEWTWVGGNNTVSSKAGRPGIYGMLDKLAPGNLPGSRESAVGWTDIDSNLWLMGGDGLDANGAAGYLNDLWEYQHVAATPTFSVAAGTYASAQTVAIEDTTPSAAIYYTTNGTTPTVASNRYAGPITVSSTEVIEAVAVATGYANSGVASAIYAITKASGTVVLSPASVTFPTTIIGSSSAPQTIVVTNTGSTALTVKSYLFSGANAGDFAITTKTCSTSLAAGASCSLSIAFRPAIIGTLSTNLVATDNGPGSPQTIALNGTGVSPPTLAFSASSLTFPPTPVGSVSPAQVLTVKNIGTSTVTVKSYLFSGKGANDFELTAKTCVTTLAAGASCTLSVAFKPATTGTQTASLIATDSSSDSPQTIALNGTGAKQPTVSLSPVSLTFATTKVGTTSAAQTLTLTNTGSVAMSAKSFSFTGPNATSFVLSFKTCGTSLAAGASCTLSVAFKPAATGTLTASLSAVDNAVGSPQAAGLKGTGN